MPDKKCEYLDEVYLCVSSKSHSTGRRGKQEAEATTRERRERQEESFTVSQYIKIQKMLEMSNKECWISLIL
jgi:hypothetical protein